MKRLILAAVAALFLCSPVLAERFSERRVFSERRGFASRRGGGGLGLDLQLHLGRQGRDFSRFRERDFSRFRERGFSRSRGSIQSRRQILEFRSDPIIIEQTPDVFEFVPRLIQPGRTRVLRGGCADGYCF